MTSHLDRTPAPAAQPGDGEWRLSPKAARFIQEALRLHLGNNDAVVDRSVPPALAKSYLDAIETDMRRLEDRLCAGGLSEDDEADLQNDLMFLKAIGRDLCRHRRIEGSPDSQGFGDFSIRIRRSPSAA